MARAQVGTESTGAARIARAAGALVLLLGGLAGSCQPALPPGAGFRWSPYGPPPGEDPGPAYWSEVADEMADRFDGFRPRGIWVACEVDFGSGGCWLDYDGDGDAVDPLIRFTGNPVDATEVALAEFDARGVEVWLQIEPGFASVEELIHLLLDRYGHHPSVLGVGVDVEWHRNAAEPALGEPVTDAQAAAWRRAVGEHGTHRLFLKHWLIGHMPPTDRRGIVFIDDSQGFPDLDALVAEAAQWSAEFGTSPVAFQIGYESDRIWWEDLPDPPARIGDALGAAVPNLKGLYWVDFTALDIFPPPGS
ncbi:MAG: hypothetical protein ACQGVK_14395 [Myxococcota bacterium]